MKKKLITLGIAIILLFSLAGLAACEKEEDNNGKEVIVGDFSLTVTVDKTKILKGGTVTVTATFKTESLPQFGFKRKKSNNSYE